MSENKVQIKGTFLGQPIDMTITECDEDTASAPDTPDVPVTPEVPSGDVPAPPEGLPEDTPADPAPDATPVSDEAPNPAGNAEQL
jgi:hypothetical protein